MPSALPSRRSRLSSSGAPLRRRASTWRLWLSDPGAPSKRSPAPSPEIFGLAGNLFRRYPLRQARDRPRRRTGRGRSGGRERQRDHDPRAGRRGAEADHPRLGLSLIDKDSVFSSTGRRGGARHTASAPGSSGATVADRHRQVLGSSPHPDAGDLHRLRRGGARACPRRGRWMATRLWVSSTWWCGLRCAVGRRVHRLGDFIAARWVRHLAALLAEIWDRRWPALCTAVRYGVARRAVAGQGRTLTAGAVNVLLLLSPADVYRLLNLTASPGVSGYAGVAGVGARAGLSPGLLLGALVVLNHRHWRRRGGFRTKAGMSCASLTRSLTLLAACDRNGIPSALRRREK